MKKLLKSQKDMGQISEPALLCCGEAAARGSMATYRSTDGVI